MVNTTGTKKGTKKNGQPPKPDREEGRICFGLAWFKSEADADKYGAYIRNRGDTYNGGWYHGMPCGRDRGFDYTDDDGVKWHAVSTA